MFYFVVSYFILASVNAAIFIIRAAAFHGIVPCVAITSSLVHMASVGSGAVTQPYMNFVAKVASKPVMDWVVWQAFSP